MDMNKDLKAYVDGELPPQEHLLIQDLIDHDPAVAHDAKVLRDVSHALTMSKPVLIDDAVSGRPETLQRLRRPAPSGRNWAYLAGLSVAASMVIAVVASKPWRIHVRSPWQLATYRSVFVATRSTSAPKVAKHEGDESTDSGDPVLPSPLPDVSIFTTDVDRAVKNLGGRVKDLHGQILGTFSQKDPDHPGSTDVIIDIPAAIPLKQVWTGMGQSAKDVPGQNIPKSVRKGQARWQIRFVSPLGPKPGR